MDSIDILIDYFSMFLKCEKTYDNDNSSIKKINNILTILNQAKGRIEKTQYFTDFNLIEEIVKKYDLSRVIDEYIGEKYTVDNTPNYVKDIVNSVNKGTDNVLYDVIYNVCRYNNYLSNKKIKTQDLPVNTDISFDSLDVKLKDILNYLDVKDGDLDKKLLDDLSNLADLDKLKELAILIKTDNGMRRVLFDKIEDKNVLVSILLHSVTDIIDSVIDIFVNEGANINKVVNNIPSIFIKDLKNSKCKYNDILINYDNFIKNYNLIKEKGINFKKMLNHVVFFINDNEINRKLIENLDSYDNCDITKNVLEYVGGILVTNPSLVFNNINILSMYGVSLTDDDNNNGYTLLGMHNLGKKLDYLIENHMWTKNEGLTLDTIDLIRGIIIKDGYSKYMDCKSKSFYGKIENASSKEDSFKNENYSEERINKVYEEHNIIRNIIQLLDDKYQTIDGIYSVGVNAISKQRILRNLCNYKGKGNDYKMFESVLKYNSNVTNIDEVINHIMPLLEMGEESVKLSQRI